MAWQLQEAKQKFSELVQRAIDDGPQVVTRRGETVVVVISVEEYRHLTGNKPSLAEFLMSGPNLGALDLDLARDHSLSRSVDL